MGDLYDKPFVPYSIVWRSAQLYLDAARAHPTRLFVVLRGNHDASRDLEASAPSTSSRGWSPRPRTSAA